MHAVIPFKDRLNEYLRPVEYILCHVRKLDKKKVEYEEPTLRQCVNGNFFDFYKLFAFLHNFSQKSTKTDYFSL